MATSYDVLASAPGNYSNSRIVSAPVTFANTTVDLDTLGVGEVVIRSWVEVTTAFNAATTNTLTLGNGVTANKFLATGDSTLGTPAVYPAAYKVPGTAETVAGTLRATYAQSGTAATAGAAVVYAHVISVPE